jgi:tetratricopeptide (TPR) repeat protein
MQNQTRRNMLLDLLKKEPDDVFLNYALAMEMIGNNEFSNAEAQLQNVLLLKPEYLPCYYQIGQLKEKLNDTNSAIEFYKKGIALAKLQNNTKAMGELNEALWMLDDE